MILRLLFILYFTISPAFAIKEGNIQKITDQKVREVLNNLKNPSLSQPQKDIKNVKIIDGIFDFNIMGKISLGKNWKLLSASDKKRFSLAFEKKIKHSFLDKLKLYNNQKVKIKKFFKSKANRIYLETHVIGIDEVYKVVYLFYKRKGVDDWFVYDVELVGVSIVQTYRKQFSEFLNRGTISELINTL